MSNERERLVQLDRMANNKTQKNKIVIAHIVYSFDEIGGLENGVINIINSLNSPPFHHVICSLKSLGELQQRVTAQNVSFFSLNKRDGNDISLPFKLFVILRREKVTVVHLRNWVTLVEGYLAAKMARVKNIIYSEHGRHFEDLEDCKTLNTIFKRRLFKRVDTLLTVSSELASEMTERYLVKRSITVVRNGVNTKVFFPSSIEISLRNSLGLNDSDFVVGSVARLAKGKNYENFITDFLANQKQNVRLVIAGDGPEYAKLEKLIIDNNAQRQIILLGNRDDIPKILRIFDAFVLPSLSEGLSNVLLEAMATGLPLIAYNVGGNPELIDAKGGFLPELGDDHSFQACIRLLAEDAILCNTMGKNNRLKAEKYFSIDSMVSKYRQIYTKSAQGII